MFMVLQSGLRLVQWESSLASVTGEERYISETPAEAENTAYYSNMGYNLPHSLYAAHHRGIGCRFLDCRHLYACEHNFESEL